MILDLPYEATQQMIRQRYLELSKKFHPDVYQGPDSHVKMQLINEAYEILSNVEKKEQYDRQINIVQMILERNESKSKKRKLVINKKGYFKK